MKVDKFRLKERKTYLFTLVEEDRKGKLYNDKVKGEFRGYEPDERRGTCEFIIHREDEERPLSYDSGDVVRVETESNFN